MFFALTFPIVAYLVYKFQVSEVAKIERHVEPSDIYTMILAIIFQHVMILYKVYETVFLEEIYGILQINGL